VALLVAHDHDRHAAEPPQAADDRLVVGELAVAAQLDELVDQAGDVVLQVRTLGMAGDHGLLPGVQAGIGFLAQLLRPVAKRLDLGLERARTRRLGKPGQLLDLAFQIGDGSLEVEIVRGHGSLNVAVAERWRT